MDAVWGNAGIIFKIRGIPAGRGNFGWAAGPVEGSSLLTTKAVPLRENRVSATPFVPLLNSIPSEIWLPDDL